MRALRAIWRAIVWLDGGERAWCPCCHDLYSTVRGGKKCGCIGDKRYEEPRCLKCRRVLGQEAREREHGESLGPYRTPSPPTLHVVDLKMWSDEPWPEIADGAHVTV